VEIDFANFEKLTPIVNALRRQMRDLLQVHFGAIPHDAARKDFEMGFFYEVIDSITKKWSVQILWELEIHHGMNFNQLTRHLAGISSRTLSDRLKTMQKAGLVTRTVEDTRPPRVRYELSDKGRGVVELSLPILWLLIGM